jgi:hypothetical protein
MMQAAQSSLLWIIRRDAGGGIGIVAAYAQMTASIAGDARRTF